MPPGEQGKQFKPLVGTVFGDTLGSAEEAEGVNGLGLGLAARATAVPYCDIVCQQALDR